MGIGLVTILTYKIFGCEQNENQKLKSKQISNSSHCLDPGTLANRISALSLSDPLECKTGDCLKLLD